jgi:hypothetical protein
LLRIFDDVELVDFIFGSGNVFLGIREEGVGVHVVL